jgi:hypothetical protein
MVRKLFLTPPSLPSQTVCRSIQIPSSREWLGIFNAALLQTAQWYNYEQVNDTDLTAEVVSGLCYLMYENWLTSEGCEMPFQLRQNPTDACLLEQSFDGGTTWSTAFDYGLCIPPSIDSLLNQVGALYNAAWQPSNYAANDTWVHSADDTAAQADGRAIALCYASKQAVGILCDGLIGVYNGVIDLVNLAEAVVTLAAPFAALLGPAAFVGFAAAISVMALEFVEEMVAADLAILADTDVRAFLACTFFEQLSSRPVMLQAFVTAFDDDFSCRTADEQRAAFLMNGVLSVAETAQRAFQGFVDLAATATLAERAGDVPSCTCPTATWTYCLPLGKWWGWSAEENPAIFNCSGGNNPATYVGGALGEESGVPVWDTNLGSAGNTVISRRFHIYVPSSTTVTWVGYSYAGTGVNFDTWAKKIDVNGDCAFWTTFPPPDGINRNGLTISGEDMIVTVVMQNSGGDTPAWIPWIKLQGTGVPLFGACNNCP